MKAILTFVASEAEFTPPVIFSQEERAKLVFRAEARLSKGEGLPLGLPVDVHLEPAP
jgi:HlyD family secretion protein